MVNELISRPQSVENPSQKKSLTNIIATPSVCQADILNGVEKSNSTDLPNKERPSAMSISKQRETSGIRSRTSSKVHFSELTKPSVEDLTSNTTPKAPSGSPSGEECSLQILTEQQGKSRTNLPTSQTNVAHVDTVVEKHSIQEFNEKNDVLETELKEESLEPEDFINSESTPQLLDPDVPSDYLSSSKSTPETMPQVGEAESSSPSASEETRRAVDNKRSTSATRPPDAMLSASVTRAAATTTAARRQLRERRTLMALTTACETTKSAAPKKRCRMFPAFLDTTKDVSKVNASRSLDGEWSIADHPNHKVLPTGPLYAQESAFPAFYDKIEIPVPLPPWDDPGFSDIQEPRPLNSPPPTLLAHGYSTPALGRGLTQPPLSSARPASNVGTHTLKIL